MERMFSCSPIHRTITALAFRRDEVQGRIPLTKPVEMLTAFPLYAQSLYIILQPVNDGLHIVIPIGIECSEI